MVRLVLRDRITIVKRRKDRTRVVGRGASSWAMFVVVIIISEMVRFVVVDGFVVNDI